MDEDRLIRSLMQKVPLSEVPEGFTGRVMARVEPEPRVIAVRSENSAWWWLLFALISIAALYFTGVHTMLVRSMLPWLEVLYQGATVFAEMLKEIFPSKKVVVPSTGMLSVIAAAIFAVLILDPALRRQFSRVTDI